MFILLICIVTLDCASAQIIDLQKNSLADRFPKKNSAVIIRPFDIYENAKNNLYGISFDISTAFTNTFSIKTIQQYAYGNRIFHESIILGVQSNLFENALQGLLIGLYPGAVFDIGDSDYTVHPKLIAEISFNAILANSIGFGLYVDDDLLDIDTICIGLGIGICFENSKYKVY
jgi:hypothetical protein